MLSLFHRSSGTSPQLRMIGVPCVCMMIASVEKKRSSHSCRVNTCLQRQKLIICENKTEYDGPSVSCVDSDSDDSCSVLTECDVTGSSASHACLHDA
jgi:hypothetical protein